MEGDDGCLDEDGVALMSHVEMYRVTGSER